MPVRRESTIIQTGGNEGVVEGFGSRCTDPLNWPWQVEHFLPFGLFMKTFNSCCNYKALHLRY